MKIYRGNKPRPLAAMVFTNRPSSFWQDFKSFLYRYRENKPRHLPPPLPDTHTHHWMPCFRRIMTAWTILVEGQQGNIPAKVNWNWSSGFWQEDFKSFLYSYVGKISPAPSGHVFQRIMTAWTILEEGHQRNIPAILNWNQSRGFCLEDFLKFSI